MKFAEEKLVGTGQAKWTVTIDGTEWKEITKKAQNRVKANIEVPGFRKGKAPESEIKKLLTPTRIFNEAFRIAVSPAFDFARSQEITIEPFNSPEPKPVKINNDLIIIDFIFDIKPEIKIGSYKEIKTVEKQSLEVTDEEVNKVLENYREQFALEKNKEGKIDNGDVVIFDFKGMVDGVEFPGGSANDFSLKIGSGQFIPGFEDSIIGKTIGDNQSIFVKFPKEYTPELAEKDAEFVLNIKEIKERILPALDNELAIDANINGVKTLEELKIKTKEDIQKQKSAQIKNQFVNAIVEEIIKNSEIEIPQTLIDRQIKDMRNEFEQEVIRQGLTMKSYKKASGLTDDQIDAEIFGDAKNKLAGFLVTNEIKQIEKFEATQEKIDAKMNELAKMYNVELDYIKKVLPLETIKSELENELLVDFLFENNGK